MQLQVWDCHMLMRTCPTAILERALQSGFVAGNSASIVHNHIHPHRSTGEMEGIEAQLSHSIPERLSKAFARRLRVHGCGYNFVYISSSVRIFWNTELLFVLFQHPNMHNDPSCYEFVVHAIQGIDTMFLFHIQI